MNQKSALNKESYASCLIVGIMALLCLFPFWVAVVNSFASENSVTLNGYSIIPKELSLDGYKYLLNNKGIMLLRSFGISFLICHCRHGIYDVCDCLLRLCNFSGQKRFSPCQCAVLFFMVYNCLQRWRDPMVHSLHTVLRPV